MGSSSETPDLPEALMAAALAVLLLFAAALLSGLLLPGAAPGDPRLQALGLPLQHGALALSAIAMARASTDGPRRALALGPARRWPAALLILPVGPLADRVVRAARGRLPELGALDTLAGAIAQPGWVGAAVAISAVLAAPVAEELLFRGYIYRGLERRLGPAAAALGGAALFGAFHRDPVHAAGAFTVGLWLGWLRWATGAIWPCIAAHVANNLIWLIALRSGWEGALPAWAEGLAALAVAGGAAAVWYDTRSEQ